MVHLHNDHVYDMLSLLKDDSGASSSSSPRRKSKVSKMIHSFGSQPPNKQRIEASLKELKIKKDRDMQDFTTHPTVVTCSLS